ncbi:hypothetical protein BAUCODRAFT_536591 [Baudoinia panamericana UAMH 10762]|uniref:Putative phospholipase n=1 Tax=Baudoinia panamericana (strain UAMH 10762) TaxID=717646 RepID=M2MFB3_BAUPA|nr:uncharacterized protein BAUCODRAFT_536591 [Baudoinia panamericana UAMH 10762]EMC95331.1 hypothetical protein BAUCODRAFT_536591 [Baudoinia panamericana UAMH 10762]
MGLPAVLRRRWSSRYILCSAAGLYIVICFLFDMPLLSSKLPNYTGKYDVGTIDIEAPCARRNVSDLVFTNTGKPAFELETVLFSLYYPAVDKVRSQKSHLWVPKPLSLTAEGYARFAKINNFLTNSVFTVALWTLVGSTKIPAQVDVPLHGTVKTYQDYQKEHPSDDDDGLPRFPVIVFSHGMASSRTSYTQYCGELASRGFIVAAIEHRDGSGPGSVIMSTDGSTTNRFLARPSELQPEPAMEDYKATGLAFRQAEIEETVRVLREINEGSGKAVYTANSRKEGVDLAEWRGRLMMDRMVLAGHSYGATGALRALKGAPSAERPFVGGIILDPGKSSGPLNDDINVPTMIIHSSSWSKKLTIFHGQPHFAVVKAVAEKILNERHKFAWFMTAKGTTHPSVTDAPLIEPMLLSWTTGATINVREGVLQYVKATQDFMRFLADGQRQGVLKEEVTHPEYDHDIRDDARRAAMNKEIEKYWQIHVAPSTACPYPGLCGIVPD